MKHKYELGIFGGKVCISNTIQNVSIGINSGKIIEIGNIDKKDCLNKIDASNKHILPGVIDTQVHFREPGLTHKEDIRFGTKSALLGGVTTIFEMPNTSPATINEEEFNKKIEIAKKSSWTNFAFFIGACKENLERLSYLENLKGCSGIKIFLGSSTGSLLVSGEEDIEIALKNCKRRVAIHSEDESRIKERFKSIKVNNGVKEHPVWRDKETALISTKKVLKYSGIYKTKSHILHISTKDEIDLLKEKDPQITVEVTPQHLTLYSPDCYNNLGTLAQMNPPIREKSHQEGLWNGINDGVVDVIGSDHAPHTLEEKKRKWPNSPSGMPGVQTLLPLMLNHVNNKKIDLLKLVQLISTNPAKIYKIKNKGDIKIGFDADITIIDLKKELLIEDSLIQSKCGWTPFHGMKVTGCPVVTIINGKIKMQNGEIVGNPNGKIVEFN